MFLDGPQNEQRIFPYTVLNDRIFITKNYCVDCTEQGGYLCVRITHFKFLSLKCQNLDTYIKQRQAYLTINCVLDTTPTTVAHVTTEHKYTTYNFNIPT